MTASAAIVKGNIFKHDGADWLEVEEYKQAGADSFVDTPGCFLPTHQGGPLLHDV